VRWENPIDIVVLGPKFVEDTEDQMVKIKRSLKETQDRKKSYANKNKKHIEFKVGEHVILEVNPKKR
jgi:hypothetical protein